MKVSVIIPVYGVENYLDACINSVVAQTYRDLEIFLVDDGSPDRCPQICDEWAEKDGRITVIHKENGGQGTARNAALDLVTGDYILFVDSDDRIMPEMVEKMISGTDSGRIDCVLCGCMVNNGLRLACAAWYDESKEYTAQEIMYEYLAARKILTGPVCKLISAEIMKCVRFPEFRANEDDYIMHEILGACGSVYVLGEHLYIQNLRAGSTENSGFNENKMRLLDCAYAIREYTEEKYPAYSEYVTSRVANACVGLLRKMYMQNASARFPECEERLATTLRKEIGTLDKKSGTYREANAYLNDRAAYRRMINRQLYKKRVKGSLKKMLVKIRASLGGVK